MEHNGIIAIDLMKRQQLMLGTLNRRVESLLSDIYMCVYVSPAFINYNTHQYYNRWANHEQSARLSADLYVKTEKKMEEMQITTDLTWIEVQFAKKAVEEVLRCRMTLKWTYAMAYYLEKSNEKDLFEDNQRSALVPYSSCEIINDLPCLGIWKRL